MSESITIHAPDGELPALRYAPQHPNGAGLVVVQEIFGTSDYIRERSRDLAALGYVVYTPVLYDRLPEEPVFDPEAPDYVMQGMTASQGLDLEVAARDVVATLEALRLEEGLSKVGLVGFCYGGGLAFLAASESDPDALVSYYGSSIAQHLDRAPSVPGPQLHHWGLDDAFIAGAVQAEIREALQGSPGPVQWETYEGAGHAFDNPHRLFHHPHASRAAWATTVDFLERTLVA